MHVGIRTDDADVVSSLIGRGRTHQLDGRSTGTKVSP